MSQQRTAELGAKLSSQERHIEELENLAASRQREVNRYTFFYPILEIVDPK